MVRPRRHLGWLALACACAAAAQGGMGGQRTDSRHRQQPTPRRGRPESSQRQQPQPAGHGRCDDVPAGAPRRSCAAGEERRLHALRRGVVSVLNASKAVLAAVAARAARRAQAVAALAARGTGRALANARRPALDWVKRAGARVAGTAGSIIAAGRKRAPQLMRGWVPRIMRDRVAATKDRAREQPRAGRSAAGDAAAGGGRASGEQRRQVRRILALANADTDDHYKVLELPANANARQVRISMPLPARDAPSPTALYRSDQGCIPPAGDAAPPRQVRAARCIRCIRPRHARARGPRRRQREGEVRLVTTMTNAMCSTAARPMHRGQRVAVAVAGTISGARASCSTSEAVRALRGRDIRRATLIGVPTGPGTSRRRVTTGSSRPRPRRTASRRRRGTRRARAGRMRRLASRRAPLEATPIHISAAPGRRGACRGLWAAVAARPLITGAHVLVLGRYKSIHVARRAARA